MITTTETFRKASFVPTATNHYRMPKLDRCVNRCRNNHCFAQNAPSFSSSSLGASFSSPQSMLLSSSSDYESTMILLPDNPLLSPLAIAIVALVLLVSAQSFINNMIDGDRGLGAFLKDGSGYNRSGYRPNTQGTEKGSSDPLPWLKLPKLDFVEVAGQTEEVGPEFDDDELERVSEELDRLKWKLNTELEAVRKRRQQNMEDNGVDYMAEARRLRAKLEELMKAYGIEYEADGETDRRTHGR